MVLPAKTFEIKEETNFGLIIQKLKDFREEETYETTEGETVTLVTEILDLSLKENLISGILSADFMRTRYYRRQLIEAPVTEEATFYGPPWTPSSTLDSVHYGSSPRPSSRRPTRSRVAFWLIAKG